jgi:hypothetical protein
VLYVVSYFAMAIGLTVLLLTGYIAFSRDQFCGSRNDSLDD